MNSGKNILPVNSNSLKRDVCALFSLSTGQLTKLIKAYDDVGKKRAFFSVRHVSNVLELRTDKASSIRSTFLYLVETVNETMVDLEILKEDLSLLGCSKTKVEFFIKAANFRKRKSNDKYVEDSKLKSEAARLGNDAKEIFEKYLMGKIDRREAKSQLYELLDTEADD